MGPRLLVPVADPARQAQRGGVPGHGPGGLADGQGQLPLMTGLAAAGQQAAAVEVFWQLKRRLDRELGIRPGPQLAAAHLRILRR